MVLLLTAGALARSCTPEQAALVARIDEALEELAPVVRRLVPDLTVDPPPVLLTPERGPTVGVGFRRVSCEIDGRPVRVVRRGWRLEPGAAWARYVDGVEAIQSRVPHGREHPIERAEDLAGMAHEWTHLHQTTTAHPSVFRYSWRAQTRWAGRPGRMDAIREVQRAAMALAASGCEDRATFFEAWDPFRATLGTRRARAVDRWATTEGLARYHELRAQVALSDDPAAWDEWALGYCGESPETMYGYALGCGVLVALETCAGPAFEPPWTGTLGERLDALRD